MMVSLALALAIVLVLAAMIQWFLAWLFARKFLTSSPPRYPNSRLRRTAVLMAVRGPDPSLRDAVTSLMNQDHPDYEIHVIVDHREDPAWSVVQQAIEKQSNSTIYLHAMKPPPETCSLKCHSLVQACEQLDDSIINIVLTDADVVKHPGWLRSLTAPLSEPEVGAVTGTQWFDPAPDALWGTWFRSLWNGGAMVPTIHYANPWAGSLALPREILQPSGLLDAWSRSIVDDGPVRAAIERSGKRLVFAPELIMINRESCSTAFVFRWASRMLTWSRMFESTFWLTVVHAVFSNAIMVANFAMLAIAVIGMLLGWTASGLAALIAAAGLIIAGLLCVAAYQTARKCAHQSCQWRGESLRRLTVRDLWNVLWSVPPAHLVFGIACLRSLFLKRVSWRGIDYQLLENGNVKRLNYAPFAEPQTSSHHSI